MHFSAKILLAGISASTLSLSGLAQEDSSTISVGAVPAIGSHRVNTLAPVTLEEPHAAAWSSGFLHLYFHDNPDQQVNFSAEGAVSSATGSVGAVPVTAMGPFLLVELSPDDEVIDSVTIHPQALVRVDRIGGELPFLLVDGDEIGSNPTGALPQSRSFVLGHIDEDVLDLEIGFEESLRVGETIDLPILTATGEDAGPYLPASDDPAIASVALSAAGDSLTVTGHAPGQVFVRVTDRWNRSDHVIINVEAETISESAPPAAPEDSAPAPEDAVVGVLPEQNPVSEETELQALVQTEGEIAAVSNAGAVYGGGESSAVLGFTAQLAGNGEVADSFTVDQLVEANGSVQVEAGHVGQPGELFVVARVVDAAGRENWFQRTQDGAFLPWDMQVPALQPVREVAALGAEEAVPIHEGALLEGLYEVYLGYRAEGEARLIYTPLPFTVEVSN